MRAEPQARALRGTGGQRSQGQCPVASVVTINVAWLWSSGSRPRALHEWHAGCRKSPKVARAGRERGPWRRARFPPCVRVGGSVSLPRFSPSGSLPLSSRVAPSAHEDRWRRESLVEPRLAMRSSRPETGKAPQTSLNRSIRMPRPAARVHCYCPKRQAIPSQATGHLPETPLPSTRARIPGGAAPYRAQERRGGADWCLGGYRRGAAARSWGA